MENDSIVSYAPIDEIVNKYANHPSIKSIAENIVKGDFSFNTVTLHDVEMVVTSLDSKKASTRNSIPTRVLKENINICCGPLTNIINSEITNSSFGVCLKRAHVAPIHKAEETTNTNNYKNVSLLPTLSKIFEKPLQPQIITLYMWLSRGVQRTVMHYYLCWKNGRCFLTRVGMEGVFLWTFPKLSIL